MKKYLFLCILIFAKMNVYATAGYGYTIHLNENANIRIYYLFGSGDSHQFSYQNRIDLQWSLLVWSKNAENILINETKSIIINVGERMAFDGEFYYISGSTGDTYDQLKNNIFSILNEYYGINASNNNLDILELYLLNWSGGADRYSENIFFSEFYAEKYAREHSEGHFYRNIENIFIFKITATKDNLFKYLREDWG